MIYLIIRFNHFCMKKYHEKLHLGDCAIVGMIKDKFSWKQFI